MPKLPQVFSEGQVGGGSSALRASAPNFDLSGLERVGREISQAANVYTRTQRALADENAKIEAEMGLGEMQRQVADAEIRLRDDPTVTPENYAQKNDDNLRMIQQGVGKSIQSPEGRMLFQRSSGRYMVQRSIKGKWDGVELGNSQAKAGTDSLLTLDENVATFGETSAIRDEGYSRGLERIDRLRRKSIYTGTEAAARETVFRSNVETGRVRLALMDPTQRSAILLDLLDGRRPFMKVDAQLDMADKEIRRAAAEKEKEEKDLALQIKDAKETAMTTWAQEALAGKTAPNVMVQKLDAITRVHKVKDTEYERLHGILTRPEKEVQSDPDTLRAVIADVESMNPKMSEATLNGFKDHEKLNTKDWRYALGRRRETLESNRREGQSLGMQQHAQAEQEVLKHLGIVTPFSELDSTQKKLLPEFLTELRRRSHAYPGGREAPIRVVEELIPRIRAAQTSDTQFSLKEIDKILTYKTKMELDAARKQGKVSDGFFISERDRLLRRDELLRKAQELETKRASQPTTGKEKMR